MQRTARTSHRAMSRLAPYRGTATGRRGHLLVQHRAAPFRAFLRHAANLFHFSPRLPRVRHFSGWIIRRKDLSFVANLCYVTLEMRKAKLLT